MQKAKGIKIAALLGGAIVVIVGIVLMVSHFLKKEDTYRSILVYELEGTAEIERENTGSIPAAENIYLESGDRLTVADGSYLQLKLDEDKYIMVEENTVLAIEAVGNAEDSKTRIELVQGAITSQIQNPLSADSEYEVTSPNSVMAVRGTIFRVETGKAQGAEAYTKTSVFSGKVSMGAPDGKTGDEVLIEAGEEGYGEGSDPIETAEIDYGKLPPQALRGLQNLLEQGAPVKGITLDELNDLRKDSENTEDTEDSGEPEETKEPEETPETEAPAGGTESRKDAKPSSGTAGTRDQAVQTTKAPQTEASGNDAASDASTEAAGQPENNAADETAKQPDHSSGETDTKKTEYTVTFLYQGRVFATQKVVSGQCATQPKLQPEAFGSWDFDFSSKIWKDTTINWK